MWLYPCGGNLISSVDRRNAEFLSQISTYLARSFGAATTSTATLQLPVLSPGPGGAIFCSFAQQLSSPSQLTCQERQRAGPNQRLKPVGLRRRPASFYGSARRRGRYLGGRDQQSQAQSLDLLTQSAASREKSLVKDANQIVGLQAHANLRKPGKRIST